MSPPRRRWLLALAVGLVGANLRPAVTSVAPVLEDIRADLGLSAAAAAALTALPILCFGLAALGAPRLTRRLGAGPTVTLALVVLTFGLGVRLVPSVGLLFAGTLLAGAGIAVGNVMVPAVIKAEFPRRVGTMMGLFVGVMGASAAVSAAATVPIAVATSLGWRAGIGVWALPGAAAVICWLAASSQRRAVAESPDAAPRPRMRRDPVAWQVTAFMGLQSLNFYALLTWLPSVFRSQGFDPEQAGFLLGVGTLLTVPAGLFVPTLAARSADQRRWAVAGTGLAIAGLTGVLLGPTSLAVAWVVGLGIGQGTSFALALTLVVLRTRTAGDAVRLSAMSQSVGYTVAAAGPFLLGLLHDLSGGWAVPLGLVIGLHGVQLLVGLGAGRDVTVGAPPGHVPGPEARLTS
jgi:MFS transporter, CP family, cyanate transporter